MCGIAGIWSGRSAEAESLHPRVIAVTEALRHRGPDDQGIWIDAGAGLGLGHRRLAIIDLSAAGHQPMHSAAGDHVIVFNGEVYNFAEIRVELDAASPGHVWRGHSDTEVILEAIARWGTRDAVRRFNGMFALAVWDRVRRRLTLARDRLGVKPLYVGKAEGGELLFASESHAIAQDRGFGAKINREALAAFLALGYQPSTAPLYADLAEVPAGAVLEITAPESLDWGSLRNRLLGWREDRGVERGRGWSLDFYWRAAAAWEAGAGSRYRGSEEEARRETEALLDDAIRLRMISDVPLGSFLSGGIDSSLVTALMRGHTTRAVKTFSIGFPESEFDESRHARAVSRHLGTDHTEFVVTQQDCLEVARRLAELQDEPLGDSSFIPTYLVSQLSRRQVTVAMTGDGGDEVFAGYWRYQMFRRVHGVYRLPAALRAAADAVFRRAEISAVAPGKPSWLWYRLIRLARLCSQRDAAAMYHYTLTAMNWRELLDFEAEVPPVGIPQGMQDRDFAEQMMWTDAVSYLPDDLLVKVDRASMRVSLECREPLLDYRLYELAARFPLEWKQGPESGKRMLRAILYRHVPRELVDRKKQGFAIPLASWLRSDLREWARERLFTRQPAAEVFFRPEAIRRLWDQHQAGTRDHKTILWHLVVLRQWLATHRWS